MKLRGIFVTTLAAGALFLSACGDDTGDVAGTDATPTAVAPVEVTQEAVDVEVPTATESEEITGTEETTDSATMTGTEEMTGTEGATGAEAMTGTEGITSTEGATGAEAMTGTEEMTGTEGVTGAEAMTGTEGITGTEGATGTEEMTGTEGITGTEDVTSAAGVTPVDEGGAADADAANIAGVLRSSELLGYDVENFEGEELGSINDAIVSLDQGCIDYMVLSFGGILGLGDSLYLIPWRAVQIDPVDQRLILNVDPAMVNDAPIWDEANQPDMAAEDWDADIAAYWEDMALLEEPQVDDAMLDEGALGGCFGAQADAAAGVSDETGETATVTETTGAETSELEVQTPRVILLSELAGYNVTNSEGEDLGEIEDLMIDWRRDQIAYAILSFGGILGLGEKWFALPLNRLTLDPIEQRLIFDIEPEVLEAAPGFDETTLPDTTDPGWDEDIRAFWESVE